MILPQELWDYIISYLPPLSTFRAAKHFYFKLNGNQEAHANLWGSIFKDEAWVQTAVEQFGVNPVLIGPDLHRYYEIDVDNEIDVDTRKRETKPAYMILLAWDPLGGLQNKQNAFLTSLQEHIHNENTGEIKFNNGIIINVKDVLSPSELLEAEDLNKLFKEESLRSSFCFWDDGQYELRTVARPNFIGKSTRLDSGSPFNLSLPGQRLLGQLLNSRLHGMTFADE